jgi:hypothetical protein
LEAVRLGYFVAGVLVILLGLLILAAGVAVNGEPTTKTVAAGATWSITPQTVNSVPVKIHWTDVESKSTIYLVSGKVACTNATGIAARGSGTNGTFSPTLKPGKTYKLYACNSGLFTSGKFTVKSGIGVTGIDIVAFLFVILGLVLVAVSFRPDPGELEEQLRRVSGGAGGEAEGPWRGWHVIARFLPMIVLALAFVVIGAANLAPHNSRESLSPVFVWIGGILFVGAILGMLFTKCPDCYRTHWVVCVQEPDVVAEPRHQSYHRDLSTHEDEA